MHVGKMSNRVDAVRANVTGPALATKSSVNITQEGSHFFLEGFFFWIKITREVEKN